MKFIDLSKLALPDSWYDRASEALAEVVFVFEECAAAGHDPDETQRQLNEAIELHSDLWRDKTLKQRLKDLSNDKCWYSEASLAGHESDVDHFRPKGAVKTENGPGYWWLAFDPVNYRLSCNYCNRWHNDESIGLTKGGKQDSFDLVDPGGRVLDYAKRHLIFDHEHPRLLDPCEKNDVGLIWFSDEGELIPHPDCTGTYQEDRVAYTAEVYHFSVFDTERATIIKDIKQKIRLVNSVLDSKAHSPAEINKIVMSAQQSLAGQTERGSPFSAAARCAIKGMESYRYTWTTQIL